MPTMWILDVNHLNTQLNADSGLDNGDTNLALNRSNDVEDVFPLIPNGASSPVETTVLTRLALVWPDPVDAQNDVGTARPRSVKVGEVVRYTVTYTPSHDRILPSPDTLHLRVRNTSALPLRAAFVHGPYTLNVSAYPSHYDPNTKFENPRRYGVPEFEPMLKAAGSWSCQLTVPDNIQESAGMGAARGDFGNSGLEEKPKSASWIVEIASQVIFSSSAAVGYEILLARDEKSLTIGSTPVVRGQAQVPQPGKVSDFQQSLGAKDGHHPAQAKGVFSKAISLKVEDTASLWNTPQLPGWNNGGHGKSEISGEAAAITSVTAPNGPEQDDTKKPRLRKIHLVILTHGLHSNLGADMLYLKESIDAAAKQAKINAQARRAREKPERDAKREASQSGPPKEQPEEKAGPQEKEEGGEEEEEEEDYEEVIVRGFSGNATRTERGIKFLGKRLARFVLSMTYPDQPYLPTMKRAAESITHAKRTEDGKDDGRGRPAHKHSTIHKSQHHEEDRKFQITSISFIGHSLGGLVQMYAIAYIQKHSPQFFNLIQPINFIAMASPLLGLSNENPLYVRFALDFGLVGRTGQDLGLTWRAPTIARSGWGAIVGTLGESAHKKVIGEVQPESKPLLRILPTGPAHVALKKFRNRTVYSNVVNDGIVPLRTSCLLFLDWQGLGRVDKARREAGLVETVVGFGWAELTGANVSTSRKGPWTPETEEPQSLSDDSAKPDATHGDSHEVPQPSSNATLEDDRRSLNLASPYQVTQNSETNNDYPFSGFFNFFRTGESSKTTAQKTPPRSPKENKIYKRSQTLKIDESTPGSASSSRSRVSSGHELDENQGNGVSGPPRTTFLESAGDLLNPKMPTVEFLLDPSRRPRTIFHDRVYHPSDIPPPPLKKRPTGSLAIRRKSNNQSAPPSPKQANSVQSSPARASKSNVSQEDSNISTHDYDDHIHTDPDRDPGDVVDSSNMKVEEKIARAYHRDLSWRKVLVKLEPDAHNNIIVRRMFANAFGWPVVKHLVDAHFSDAVAARTRDEDEQSADRTKAMNESPDVTGAETGTQEDAQPQKASDGIASSSTGEGCQQTMPSKGRPPNKTAHSRTESEALEATDTVPDMPISASQVKSRASHSSRDSPPRTSYERMDSATWSDRDFADSEDESEMDMDMAFGNHMRVQTFSQEGEGKDKDNPKRTGSPAWNWTEKIVGKGARSRKGKKNPQSPVSPGPISSGLISPMSPISPLLMSPKTPEMTPESPVQPGSANTFGKTSNITSDKGGVD
ncbi:putative serine esterase-domain-containing protein [Biscogniauxia marginata]|nr:putative serine esterase-domain-containing protein [Biscogniauxia marginata]